MNNYKLPKTEYVLLLLILAVSISYIGAAANQAAVKFNNNQMPVKTDVYIDSIAHFTYQDNSEVQLWYLTDIFKLNKNFISIGDILIDVGMLIAWILILYYIFLVNKRKKESEQ